LKPALVLASASPRRRALLAELGVAFEVLPSDVPEQPRPGESPGAFAVRVAHEKGREVAGRRPDRWVLAADTVVVLDGEILGKPRDRDDARRMLLALSASVHHVLTAVALLAPSTAAGEELLIESEVTFRRLTGAEIETYLDSGEPFDKAGAYAIQGGAADFVTTVAGSYTNVVGLPLEELRALLRRHGLLAAATGTAESAR
jgi:septum formation protein